MPRTLSEAAFRAIQAESSGDVWLDFIEVTHADLDAPLRFVAGTDEDVVIGEVTWTAAPVSVTLPPDGGERLASVQLVVPAIDTSIMDDLAALADPPRVAVHQALASSPSVVETGPYDLLVADGQEGVDAVILDLSYEDILNRPVIPYSYTPQRTPALHK